MYLYINFRLNHRYRIKINVNIRNYYMINLVFIIFNNRILKIRHSSNNGISNIFNTSITDKY